MIAWLLRIVLAALVLGVVAWLVVPREPVNLVSDYDPTALGQDLDRSLAAQEAEVPHLRAGLEKRLVWAEAPGARTPLSVVYLHGFSASSEEIRPVPDRVAAHLGANLYYARLSGHGRDGPAMAEPMVHDWINDAAEAMEIGRRIGDRVILMGTSVGGALAALVALDPQYSEDLAGVVLISPAFKLRARGTAVLTWPGARTFVPRLLGETRSFTPVNEAHRKFWTSEYPSVSVLPMAALVKAARQADLSLAQVPALFLLSDADAVVDPTEIRAAATRWGGPRQIVPVALGSEDDPVHHVLAGDALSPGQTQTVVRRILVWAMEL